MEDRAMFEALQAYAAKKLPLIHMTPCDPKDLIFEERVKLNCFYCARYNVSWRCPPRIPQLDYPKILGEFQNAAFVWLDLPMTKANYADVRNESSVKLHHAILELEKVLLQHNYPENLSFIAGSCKLCKSGCGKEKCNNPYLARIPLEATGVNVVKSAAKYGIDIHFPAETHLMRVGLILW